MNHPVRGVSYRFEHKRRWTLRTDPLRPFDGSFWLYPGDVITCLDPSPEMFFNASAYKRRLRIWMARSRVVFDAPIGAECNGREDNLMNYLVELR